MSMRRYLHAPIRADLAEKMVFLAGPRQVGKTTLGRQLLVESGEGVYLNWDNRADRRRLQEAAWPGGRCMVVLDEIHKWRSWKGWIKGEYDKHREHIDFLVTGSARLDLYRRGGDSLQGRYHHYRLHPLSCAELDDGVERELPVPGRELSIPQKSAPENLELLMRFGGFPEPFLAQAARTLRRWRKERIERFFREDVRDLESIRGLSSIELLADLLPERVASPLSLNGLREDLEVSHRAVTHWMEILERLYYIFRIAPFASTRIKGLRKMAKCYLWDLTLIQDPGRRFENLVALHLLKFCHLLEDREGYRVELRYLRDRAGREVDFLVTIDGRPWFAVEAKKSETRVDPNLHYFQQRLEIPWLYQVVLESKQDVIKDGVRCLPAHRFLAALA